MLYFLQKQKHIILKTQYSGLSISDIFLFLLHDNFQNTVLKRQCLRLRDVAPVRPVRQVPALHVGRRLDYLVRCRRLGGRRLSLRRRYIAVVFSFRCIAAIDNERGCSSRASHFRNRIKGKTTRRRQEQEEAVRSAPPSRIILFLCRLPIIISIIIGTLIRTRECALAHRIGRICRCHRGARGDR